jgi:predicted transporter
MDEYKNLPRAYLVTPVAFFCGGLLLILIGFTTVFQRYVTFGSVFLMMFGILDLISGVILYRIEKSYWLKNNKLLIGKREVITGLFLGFLIIVITIYLRILAT